MVPETLGRGRRARRCQRTAAAEPSRPAEAAPPIRAYFPTVLLPRLPMASVYQVWLVGQDLAPKLLLMVRFRTAMKKILVSLVLVQLLLAALPTAAGASAGKLDRGFGQKGRVMVGLPAKELELAYPQKPKAARMAMAALPGGGFVAANNRYLIERRKDGGPVRGFGNKGKL